MNAHFILCLKSISDITVQNKTDFVPLLDENPIKPVVPDFESYAMDIKVEEWGNTETIMSLKDVQESLLCLAVDGIDNDIDVELHQKEDFDRVTFVGNKVNLEPVEYSLQNPVENSIQKPVNNSFLKPVENSIRKPTKTSLQKPTKNSIRKPTKKSLQKPTKNSFKKPTMKDSVLKPTKKDSVQKRTKNPLQKATKKSGQKPTKKSVQKPTKNSGQKPTKNSLQKPTKKSLQKPVKNVTEERIPPFQTNISLDDRKRMFLQNHASFENNALQDTIIISDSFQIFPCHLCHINFSEDKSLKCHMEVAHRMHKTTPYQHHIVSIEQQLQQHQQNNLSLINGVIGAVRNKYRQEEIRGGKEIYQNSTTLSPPRLQFRKNNNVTTCKESLPPPFIGQYERSFFSQALSQEYIREPIISRPSAVYSQQFEETKCRMRNEFEQTGSRMRNGYEQTESRMRNECKQTESRIRNECEQTESRMRNEFEQTGSHMRNEYEQTESRMRNVCEQTESRMRNGYEQTESRMRNGYEQTESRMRNGYEQTESRMSNEYIRNRRGSPHENRNYLNALQTQIFYNFDKPTYVQEDPISVIDVPRARTELESPLHRSSLSEPNPKKIRRRKQSTPKLYDRSHSSHSSQKLPQTTCTTPVYNDNTGDLYSNGSSEVSINQNFERNAFDFMAHV